MYIKERNASTLEYVGCKGNRATYTLNHNIADYVCAYNYPLSIRVPLPEGWTDVDSVTQDGASLIHRLDGGMVYMNATPNGGEIVLRNDSVEQGNAGTNGGTTGTNVGANGGTTSGDGTSADTAKASGTTAKKANTMKVKGKTVTVKGATQGKKGKLKKTRALGPAKVIVFKNKGQGTKTYVKASGNKKITIDKRTGKVTVKKGLKKGNYKVKVKVRAAGNSKYKAVTGIVTFTVKVRR